MGAWGHDFDECDGFLNLYGACMKPIEKALKVPKNGHPYKMDDAISASGLLCEIISNKRLRYRPDTDLAKKAIDILNRVLSEYDFSGWKNPKLRKRYIRKLIERLSNIGGARTTSLGRKLQKRYKTERKG